MQEQLLAPHVMLIVITFVSIAGGPATRDQFSGAPELDAVIDPSVVQKVDAHLLYSDGVYGPHVKIERLPHLLLPYFIEDSECADCCYTCQQTENCFVDVAELATML